MRAAVEALERIDPYASIGDRFGALVDLLAAAGFELRPLRHRATSDDDQDQQHRRRQADPGR